MVNIHSEYISVKNRPFKNRNLDKQDYITYTECNCGTHNYYIARMKNNMHGNCLSLLQTAIKQAQEQQLDKAQLLKKVHEIYDDKSSTEHVTGMK